MARNGKDAQVSDLVRNDLEPYRRLVELQKQMIELAQQHEQSRRECDALRVQVAKEIAQCLREKSGFNHRLRAAMVRLNWFNRKESSC
jgi:hypothetical protein